MYLYRDKKDDFAFNKYPTIHHNTVPFKTCAIKQKIYQIVFVHKLYCFLEFNKRYTMKNDTKTTHINWFLKSSSTKHLKTHTKNQSSLFVIGYSSHKIQKRDKNNCYALDIIRKTKLCNMKECHD